MRSFLLQIPVCCRCGLVCRSSSASAAAAAVCALVPAPSVAERGSPNALVAGQLFAKYQRTLAHQELPPMVLSRHC